MVNIQLSELAQAVQKANEMGLKAQLRLIRHKSQPRIVADASGPSGSMRLVFPYRIRHDQQWDELQLPCPSNIQAGVKYPLPKRDLSAFISLYRWWFGTMTRPNARVEVEMWYSGRPNTNTKHPPKATLNLGGPCTMVIEDAYVYLRAGHCHVRVGDFNATTAAMCQQIVDKFEYAIAPDLEPPQAELYDRYYFSDDGALHIVLYSPCAELVGLFVTNDHIVFRPAPDIDPNDPRTAVVIRKERWIVPIYLATDGQRLLQVNGSPETGFIAVPTNKVMAESLSLNDLDSINELLKRHKLHRFVVEPEKAHLTSQ